MGSSDLPYLSSLFDRTLLRLVAGAHRPLVHIENPLHLAAIDDPAIFALNHNNYFESIGVPAALFFHRGGRLIHFMVDWMFLHLPLVGWLIRQTEPVPVYTKSARWRFGETYRQSRRRRSPLVACLDLLERGESVGIFPEGTRNPDPGTMLRGRVGAGRLVLRSDAPVVPVGIEFPAARRLGRVPAAGRLHIRIGEPLHFAEERRTVQRLDEGSHERRRVESTLGRLVIDRMMCAIAELCSKSYPHGNTACRSKTVDPSRPGLILGGSE